jgi:hypothetical protein
MCEVSIEEKHMRRMIRYLTVIFLILLTGCSQSQNSKPKIISTFSPNLVDSLVLKNLSTKRIVMLGDAYHMNGYYMRLVTGVLNYWIDKLEEENSPKSQYKNDSMFANRLPNLKNEIQIGNSFRSRSENKSIIFSPLPQNIILFIEADPEGAKIINDYLNDGDLAKLLEYRLFMEMKWGSLPGGITVDVVEYLKKLRMIKDRIKKLNSKNSLRHYDFKVIGAEGSFPYDLKYTTNELINKKRYKAFEKERFNYFVYKRDVLCANNIKNILNENAKYKALIFYGTAHLQRGLQNKGEVAGPTGGPDTANSYYLATYLDNYFSRDSVSVFFTDNIPNSQNERIEQFAQDKLQPDYLVLCKPIPFLPFPLEIINSQITLKTQLNLLEKYDKLGDEEGIYYGWGFAHRLYYNLKRSYLYFQPNMRSYIDSMGYYANDTTAARLRRDEIAAKIIPLFDAVENIDELKKWITMESRDTVMYLIMLRRVLASLPPPGLQMNTAKIQYMTLNAASKEMIENHIKEIQEYLLINLLKIGTQAEQNEAMKDLNIKTGMNLKSENEWNKWWQKKYYN